MTTQSTKQEIYDAALVRYVAAREAWNRHALAPNGDDERTPEWEIEMARVRDHFAEMCRVVTAAHEALDERDEPRDSGCVTLPRHHAT